MLVRRAAQAAGDSSVVSKSMAFTASGSPQSPWRRSNIGKEGAEPVTDDYPGEYPWPFIGGTIERAAVDVSGQPFVDLAQAARMAFARD